MSIPGPSTQLLLDLDSSSPESSPSMPAAHIHTPALLTPALLTPVTQLLYNDHSSYRVDRVPIDFHEYICVDT